MVIMEASDIVIHKGEKEEKYQLYVEDYVMSYLKNYRTADKRKIFFYGERLPNEKKYYIYGAGRQEQISYFEKYKLLDEITCNYVMDMPVFSVREKSGNYELSGYYIFYQSNDAMQSYMIEQRKKAEYETKSEDKNKAYIKDRAKSAEEIKSDSRKPIEKEQKEEKIAIRKPLRGKGQKKAGNGLMTAQLLAIFIIIAVIAVNSTNSYDKLRDLGQSAVEVFFVLENQDAAENIKEDDISDNTSNETILRLTDLDEKFAQENDTAKLEEENNTDKSDAEVQESEGVKDAEEPDSINEPKTSEEPSSSEQAFSRNITEYYRIEKGDTLYTISIKIYGDSSKVAEICELNQITDPDHIEYGQKILLP